ncbi:MAG: hypothetical protein HFE77_05140 [Clostridiales bacterium]|nr:hypothetical protein [Clostridiales bacterium]
MSIQTIETKIKSPLFLTAAILLTVSNALELISNHFFPFNIFGILYTIGAWMLYMAVSKGSLQNGRSASKLIKGSVKAQWIVNWVLVGLLGLLFLLCIVAFPVVSTVLASLEDSVSSYDLAFATSVSGVAVAIVAFAILIVAGAYVLINIFWVGNLSKFTDGFDQTVATGRVDLPKLNVVKNWLLVLTVWSGINAIRSFSHMTTFIAEGCACAVCILFYLMLKDVDQESAANETISTTAQASVKTEASEPANAGEDTSDTANDTPSTEA